jgi:hypothetical protein
MSVATDDRTQAAMALTAPLHGALALPEIISAVLEHLWVPDLRHARLVCRLWASVGLPLIWRSAAPLALTCVPNSDGRRQYLAPYVRRLIVDSRTNSIDDLCFPQVWFLCLPSNALQEHVVLLGNCGLKLLSLFIHNPLLSVRTATFTKEASLTADEVAMVASLPRLSYLLTGENRILDICERSTADKSAATMQLLHGVVDPFPVLHWLKSTMYATTMLLVLPLMGRLTTLQVRVEWAQALNVLPAIVQSLPQLQVLRLRFKFGLHSSWATGHDVLALQRLRQLRVLDLAGLFDNGVGQFLSSAKWAAFVAHLPLLECVSMPKSLSLPPDALRILEEGCSHLLDVTLRDECDIEALDHGPRVVPCFPTLSKVKIACFSTHSDGEAYVFAGLVWFGFILTLKRA